MQNPERRGAMTGYLVVALGVAAAAFERGAPSANAPIAESIAFYSKYRSELLTQSILFVLSAGAYLWFFGSLRTWLERAEGGAGRVSAVAFGAGTVSVAMQMLLQTLQIAAVTGGASGSDAGGAALFARVGWALSVVAYVPFAVLVAATAVVSLRHRALPTWIGWFSALVAGAHIVMFIGIAADSGPLVPGGALTYVLYGLALVWLISVTTVIVVGGKSAVRMERRQSTRPSFGSR
jgi:hypothetical protein